MAPCVRVPPGAYPDGLVAAAKRLPPGPWLYTGALENRPDLIDRLASSRPLWGNDAPTVRAARDPVTVAEALRAAGLHSPDVRLDPTGLPHDGSWLRKPLASAGGVGIEPLGPLLAAGASRPSYYQRRVDGLSLSAVFVGARPSAALAGVTRQLTGRPGSAFAYRGTLAPWPVEPRSARRIDAMGQALSTRLGLVGLFGVDFVLDHDGEPWAVEINPRYTASVEALELALARPLLADHRNACEGRPIGLPEWTASFRGRFVAKEIVFAGSSGVFPGAEAHRVSAADPFQIPAIADVPDAGTPFEAGDPVLTVFASGDSPGDAFRSLGRHLDAWRGVLIASAPS